MGLLIVFLDGVGLGADDPVTNPLAAAPMPVLRGLLGGAGLTRAALDRPAYIPPTTLVALDATLGVAGLPQSGTGQATLWSGINVAARIGRHSGPYAPPQAREILLSNNLFQAAAHHPRAAAFANAYPPRYLDRLERGTARQSVTALAAYLGGATLRGPDELRQGEAVSAFVTNELWATRLGVVGMPEVTAFEAGENLARLARRHAVTVFEFFATDMAGHRRDPELTTTSLERIDGLLGGVVATLDPARDLLLVTSDHGNLEDATSSEHTLNPAPGLVWGAGAFDMAARLASLADVTPTALDWLAGAR